MTSSYSSGAARHLAERTTVHLAVLLGALRTLQARDPRLTPTVRDAILACALRNATELGALVESTIASERPA